MDNRLFSLAETMAKTNWDDETNPSNPFFSIEQFQGSAFDSSYKCAKVTTLCGSVEDNGFVFPKCFVAKVSSEKEAILLRQMREKGISVPQVYGTIPNEGIMVIFEEYVEGHEIYHETDTRHWITLSRELSKIHDLIVKPESKATVLRLKQARTSCQSEPTLKAAFARAITRISDKRTYALVHGDMFPTNVIVRDDGTITILDWKDAGRASYMNDLGRLTATIDLKTKMPFCPCEDDVRDSYYECVKGKYHYEDYLQDFYAGQFVELAANYYPEMAWNSNVDKEDKEFNMATRDRLIRIASKIG